MSSRRFFNVSSLSPTKSSMITVPPPTMASKAVHLSLTLNPLLSLGGHPNPSSPESSNPPLPSTACCPSPSSRPHPYQQFHVSHSLDDPSDTSPSATTSPVLPVHLRHYFSKTPSATFAKRYFLQDTIPQHRSPPATILSANPAQQRFLSCPLPRPCTQGATYAPFQWF